MRRARLGLALVGLVAACHTGEGSATSAGPSGNALVDAPPPMPSARRPTRRYSLVRTSARCDLLWMDGEQRSAPTETPCPLELEVGEAARITGKTCTRDSGDAARVMPIPCPNALLLFERDARARDPARPR